MSRSAVVRIDKNWWKHEREGSDSSELIVKRKRKLPSSTFSIPEISKRFGISNDLLYKAIKNSELRAYPFGRIYRIAEEDLLDYFDLQAKKKGIA